MNTTVSTLSLSRRHSACRGPSLSFSLALSSSGVSSPSLARLARSLLRPGAPYPPFRVGHVVRPEGYPVDSTHLHPPRRAALSLSLSLPPERGSPLARTHACACVRDAPVRFRSLAIFGSRISAPVVSRFAIKCVYAMLTVIKSGRRNDGSVCIILR